MRILAVSVVGILVAWGQTPSPRGGNGVNQDTTVAVTTFQFRPTSLVAPVGTRVVWTNGDEIEHTITAGVPDSASGAFNGSVKAIGATFSHTFTRAGTYSYFCERHHFMRGEIRVTPTGEN